MSKRPRRGVLREAAELLSRHGHLCFHIRTRISYPVGVHCRDAAQQIGKWQCPAQHAWASGGCGCKVDVTFAADIQHAVRMLTYNQTAAAHHNTSNT